MFEILMQSIEPIKLKASGKAAEGERSWLNRALTKSDNSYQWISSVSWTQPNCVDYFLTSQYDGIRCNLFHSKGGHILPNEQVAQQLVNKMFLELQELCLFLLNKLFPLKGWHGGITYQGFNLMMKSVYSQTTAYISEKPVPKGYVDGTAQLDKTAVILNRVCDSPSLTTGIAEYIYSRDFSPESCHRIRNYGTNQEQNVLSYCDFFDDVLEFNGVDCLSIHLYNRLVNRGESKKF